MELDQVFYALTLGVMTRVWGKKGDREAWTGFLIFIYPLIKKNEVVFACRVSLTF